MSAIMGDIPRREAFRLAQMADAIKQAEMAVERARLVFQAARGREKAPLRKQLSRVQNALSKLVGEQKSDVIGEQFAPAVQRRALVDRKRVGRGEGGEPIYEDVMLREARVIEVKGKVQLVSVLDKLKARGAITLDEHRAGKRYRDAWEMAHMDQMPIGLGECAPGGSPSGGNRRIEQAVGSGRELAKLRAMVGPMAASLLDHTVVHELHWESWAVERAINRHHAIGLLKAALIRLDEGK